MDLFVYDQYGKLCGAAEPVSSLRWRRKYFEPGEVELHIPATHENIALYLPERILHMRGRKESALIEGISINGDDLTVSGRMLSCCFDWTVISNIHQYNDTYENIIRNLVSIYFQYCAPLSYRLAESIGVGDIINTQISRKTLGAVVANLSKAGNIGNRLYFNPIEPEWVFEIYQGSQLTNIAFSDEYGNAVQRYTHDRKEYRNKIYIFGAGEGEAREKQVIDLSNGQKIREAIVDARDITKNDENTAVYNDLLIQRGKEKASEMEETLSLETDIDPNIQWKYREDYDLGDVVPVISRKWGIAMDKRITEIEEVYEMGVCKVTPVFGNPLPEKIKMEELNG